MRLDDPIFSIAELKSATGRELALLQQYEEAIENAARDNLASAPAGSTIKELLERASPILLLSLAAREYCRARQDQGEIANRDGFLDMANEAIGWACDRSGPACVIRH